MWAGFQRKLESLITRLIPGSILMSAALESLDGSAKNPHDRHRKKFCIPPLEIIAVVLIFLFVGSSAGRAVTLKAERFDSLAPFLAATAIFVC